MTLQRNRRRARRVGLGFQAGAAAALSLGAAAIAGVLALGVAPGHGAESARVPGAKSAVRLVAAGHAADGRGPYLRAGVDVTLDPGWKTYWRYPGDAGIPPRFDFSRSANVKDVEVLWPAPQRVVSGPVTSIGYAGQVVFPIKVRPRDPSRAVTLVLDLDYAVCEAICIPAQAQVTLGLPAAQVASLSGAVAASSATAGLIGRFEARVPQPRAVGATAMPSIQVVSVDRSRTPARVVVDVRAPGGGDLFAEGPDDGWSLPVPVSVPAPGPGLARFAFDLDGRPAGGTAAATALRLTFAGPDGVIETLAPLD